MKPVTVILVLALFSSMASAGPLLDRFMPYRDFYAEGASTNPCELLRETDGNAALLEGENCPLDEQTQSTLRGLLGENLDGTAVTLDNVADALRDMLAQGQSVDNVVAALPPFIRQYLPNMLQSRNCQFQQNGDVSAHFEDAVNEAEGSPYDEFITVTIFCDKVRNFRVVLTGFAEHTLSQHPSTPIYQRSSVPVKLVSNQAAYPAQVSFLNEGRLLSEQVFAGGFGETDIPIVVRLHSPTNLDEAPKGQGEIHGFPPASRLVIYEID